MNRMARDRRGANSPKQAADGLPEKCHDCGVYGEFGRDRTTPTPCTRIPPLKTAQRNDLAGSPSKRVAASDRKPTGTARRRPTMARRGRSNETECGIHDTGRTGARTTGDGRGGSMGLTATPFGFNPAAWGMRMDVPFVPCCRTGSASLLDRLDALRRETRKAILHSLELLRCMPLPLGDLAGDTKWVPRAV